MIHGCHVFVYLADDG